MKITKTHLRENIKEELMKLLESNSSMVVPRDDHSSRKLTELDTLVQQFVNTIAKKYGYSTKDAKFGITQSLKKLIN